MLYVLYVVSTYGRSTKCKLKEGCGPIIRNFCKHNVVSILECVTNALYVKRVYEVSVAFIGKYHSTADACR